jgi:hypothetical protein
MDPTTPDLAGHDHRPGHEPTDISLRPILRFLGALVASGVVIQLLLVAQLDWYVGEESPAAGKIGPLPPLKRQPTAEPRLQEASTIDLGELRRREQAELESSGWVDEKARTVRIPIDEAMRVIAEGGLPARKSQQGAAGAVAQPENSDAR